jgi:hypothetical protein
MKPAAILTVFTITKLGNIIEGASTQGLMMKMLLETAVSENSLLQQKKRFTENSLISTPNSTLTI